MIEEEQKELCLGGDEFLAVLDVVRFFTAPGRPASPPVFAVFMGGVGAGKTTLRRRECAEGFVHFEPGEIGRALTRALGADHPRLEDCLQAACHLLLDECLAARHSLAIEVVGSDRDRLLEIVGGMKALGYSPEAFAVECAPDEAYARHVRAVRDDEDYVSCFYTEEAT